MLHPSGNFILNRLNERKQAGNFRTLKPENDDLIDFSSNDYLGFARSARLKQLIADELKRYPDFKNGSTGSRLLTGNLNYTEDLEQQIAAYHGHEAGLLFNSGYDVNIGLFSSLPQRGDTVITDELIHASIIDGIRMSNANRYTFKHNDLASLEEKLKNSKGNIYVVIETVYSMDGDCPPFKEIIALTQQYNANLIADEAHAIGVFGNGLIDTLALQDHFFARIITYGKAMGVHGAIVMGNNMLRDYLINFARSFIYSTAASFYQLASIKTAYELLKVSQAEMDKLKQHISIFKQEIITKSNSAIHCVIIGSNEHATRAAKQLQLAGIDVRPVLSPTVAAGTERLRICLHSYNTTPEVELLTFTLKTLING